MGRFLRGKTRASFSRASQVRDRWSQGTEHEARVRMSI